MVFSKMIPSFPVVWGRGLLKNSMLSAVSPRAKHTLIQLATKHYALTYLVSLVSLGFGGMISYGAYCALYNPNIDIPFWDKVPRYHSYADKDYNGMFKPHSNSLNIPVMLRHDGSLKFSDGTIVTPDDVSTATEME